MKSEIENICRRLRESASILVVTHARPDGDCLGSAAALVRSARASGRQARALVPDKVPQRYSFLFDQEAPAGAEQFASLADCADAIVVVDTSAPAQLDGMDKGILGRHDKVVVIDHHNTSQTIGAVQWIDPSAAAAGIMVGEVLETLGWPVDLLTAEALMVAVTSDTGWLRFANTDSRCLRAVAAWLDAGLKPDVLYQKLFQCDRAERLRMMTRMLQSLELACDGRVASMVICRQDFVDTGALPEETENMVNEALRIGSVEAAMLLVENGPQIRVSLRSREAIDVAAIAAKFGGGGHARAAGLRAAMDIHELRRKLVEACSEAVRASR